MGNNIKLYTYKGKSRTLLEWAEETDMKTATLLKRIDRLGWSIEKALTTPEEVTEVAEEKIPKMSYRKYRPIRLKKKNLNLNGWSEITGIPATVLYKRLLIDKLEPSIALMTPWLGNPKKYFYEGEVLSLLEWSEKTGISYEFLFDKIILRDMEFEDAVKIGFEKFKKYTYKGKSLTLAEWSEETGISYNVLRHRIKRWGDVEKVFFKPVINRKTIVTLTVIEKGKSISYTVDASKDVINDMLGISKSTAELEENLKSKGYNFRRIKNIIKINFDEFEK